MIIELDRTANASQVVTALQMAGRKGSNIYVQWQRTCPLKKSAPSGVTVEKVVTAPVRYGVDYANLATVKAGIEAGVRGDVEALPWGTWRKGYEGLIIDHVKDGKPVEYIRFTGASFASMEHKTTWLLNGAESDLATVKQYLPSDQYKRTWNVFTGTLKDGTKHIEGTVTASDSDEARDAAKEKFSDRITGVELAPMLAFNVRASDIVAIGVTE